MKNRTPLMQYAINEGFAVVYYWVTDDGMELEGVAYVVPSAKGSFRQKGCENRIFTIFGRDYTMDNNFYLDYGIQVENRYEAEAKGREWCSEWIGALREIRKELPEAVC